LEGHFPIFRGRPVTPFAAPIAEAIWDMKYRLKEANGRPIDGSVEETWRRIARALAAAEKEPARWEESFYAALRDFRFLPAGRIVAGAGTERTVTLFNCFVMGTIPDSLDGIFQALKEAALTMQQGGGIGYDFSTIRPKGAAVRGVAADASGPLSFMDVWDAMCRTIMSAGSRRGAMMATLRCDHPDIEEFVSAKSDPARLRNFNLSVLATDAFMAAVKAGAPWELRFGGKVYKTVEARALWDKIMRATYDYAEPGVIFIDRINAMNNLNYAETISATNPCVPAECWVETAEGARQVKDLVGRPFVAIVDGRPWLSAPEGFFPTGRKPLLKLTTHAGRILRLTANHKVRKIAALSRWRREAEWAEAGTLRPGDRIAVSDHRARGIEAQDGRGYLLGLLVGDGTIKADKTVLSVWRPRACVGAGAPPDPVMAAAEAALRALPHRADFAGWIEVPGRGECRMSTAALGALARDYGLGPGRKTITPEIERAAPEFCAAFLRGLFDADGSVQGSREKGVSVRLSQSDLALLRRAQAMLSRLGINATIYEERRPEGRAFLPDGKGGRAEYGTRAQHELIVSGENIALFAARVGFTDPAKAARLSGALGAYARALNRERFTDEIATIEEEGEAEVFDVRVPGVNAFDGDGFVLHNCGEQPLPPYGACLLGSINLARLVKDPFGKKAAMDLAALDDLTATAIRMMDNVVDVSRFPLPQQWEEAQAKRRLGLGVTGLADALLMLGLRYGSDAAAEAAEAWMHRIARAAYLTSVELAREKGAFPLFDAEKFLASGNMTHMDADIRDAVRKNGIRNALLTSIAPTGTISLYAGNVSSGIEPVFAYAYTRKVLQKDGSRTEEEVADYAVSLWRARFGEKPLPDYFVDAQSLAPLDHVRMQASVQKWVDSSISKTINVPEEITFEAFKDVYLQAYEAGCKGCTTYRPNQVTGSVLAVSEKEAPKAAGGEVVYLSEPLDRPAALEGNTYKLKWPDSEHALYITLNDIVIAGHRRPFEVFINSKNMEHFAWTVALTRMISAVFRRGGDVSFVVEELKAVFDPRGGAWMEGKYIPSILAAIGGVIERHLIAIGFIQGEGMGLKSDPKAQVVNLGRARACPSCGSFDLNMIEGCLTCANCGYSKCG
jgi:ribonucleoside-diphosphate reductase alpha chain